jgi:hypothetical protein
MNKAEYKTVKISHSTFTRVIEHMPLETNIVKECGIVYKTESPCMSSMVFNILNNKTFVLAKIKYGL